MNQEIDVLAHGYITKLRLLAKIQSGGKLATVNNSLDIYRGSFKDWAKRMYNADGRKKTITYLQTLYREIRMFTNSLINNITHENDEINLERKLDLLISIAEQTRKSIIGLESLKETYKDCPKTLASLECIEKDCAIPLYKSITSFIPKFRQTELLRTPIVSGSDSIIAHALRSPATRPGASNSAGSFSEQRILNKAVITSRTDDTVLKQKDD